MHIFWWNFKFIDRMQDRSWWYFVKLKIIEDKTKLGWCKLENKCFFSNSDHKVFLNKCLPSGPDMISHIDTMFWSWDPALKQKSKNGQCYLNMVDELRSNWTAGYSCRMDQETFFVVKAKRNFLVEAWKSFIY